MTWHCDTHGAVTPDHYGTSYRCPYCTGRTVWREERRAYELTDGTLVEYAGRPEPLEEEL